VKKSLIPLNKTGNSFSGYRPPINSLQRKSENTPHHQRYIIKYQVRAFEALFYCRANSSFVKIILSVMLFIRPIVGMIVMAQGGTF
jgi:hypothetical protein